MIKEFADAINTLFNNLDRLLEGKDGIYLAGDKITIADFIIFSFAQCFVGNPCVRHHAMNDAAKNSLENNELFH